MSTEATTPDGAASASARGSAPEPGSRDPSAQRRREAASQRDVLHRAERERKRDRKRRQRNAVFACARALIRWLPLSVASALGEFVGLLAWALVPWMRRQTINNLEIAYGAELSAAERRRICRRCYGLAGRGMFAWIVLHRMGPQRALARVVQDLTPEAAEVLASPSGAIVLTQHSGLFELSGALGARDYRLVAVGREAGDDPGTSLLIRMRQEMGLRTIEQGSPREILRTLREGGRVGMLADQDIRKVNGAFVPFFGRLAHTPLGPAALAARMKVPIVCATMEWRSFTTHTARVVDVLRVREDLSGDEAVLELTARCSDAIERAVRRRPAEWLWMHDRWRTSPADHPDEAALERHGQRFLDKVLTAAEQALMGGREGPLSFVAGRFAAKEAVLKVLGTGWAQGLGFCDVEVLRDDSGRPHVVLHGPAAERARTLGFTQILISITHSRRDAIAVAAAD